MSSHLQNILFRLIRIAIGTEQVGASFEVGVVEWPKVYEMARKQGVLAVVFDGLAKVLEQDKEFAKSFPRDLKLRWIMQTQSIEQTYARQLALSAELAERFAESDIATVCLKGLAVAKYYSVPSHRECGDFDCFLFDKFEEGNKIAEELGAKVRFDDYKHSHIAYRGLMIENHKYCTPIRGSAINKKFEIYLQSLLATKSFEYLGNSKIITPPPTFNALFIARHSLTHFLYEGISVRHLIDWAYLLKYEQNHIEWDEFYRWCDLMNMRRFVNVMNSFADQYIGVEITHSKVEFRDRELKKFVNSTLYDMSSVYNQPKTTLWRQRFTIAKNMFLYRWKYRDIYQKSLFLEWCKSLYGVFFEKHPKL